MEKDGGQHWCGAMPLNTTNGYQSTMSNRHKDWLVQEQTTLGKDFSNPLMADNLPKIIWLSTYHIYLVKELASPQFMELLLLSYKGYIDPRPRTYRDYGSGVARPKIDDKCQFELKGQFLKELQENTFSGSDNEDANEHIEKVLKIVDLFHVPNIIVDQLMLRVFPISLTRVACRWLRNESASSITT
ncbi:hypothetical protein Tco_1276303 [Tanacetum coccineum]